MTDMRYDKEISDNMFENCINIQAAGYIGSIDDYNDYSEQDYSYLIMKQEAKQVCEKEKLEWEKAEILYEADEKYRKLSDHYFTLLSQFVNKYKNKHTVPSSLAYTKLERKMGAIVKKSKKEYSVGPVFYQECIYNNKYRHQPGTVKDFTELEAYRQPFIYRKYKYKK